MSMVYVIAAVLVGVVLAARWSELPAGFRWAGVAFACLLVLRGVARFRNGPSGMAGLDEDADAEEPPREP